MTTDPIDTRPPHAPDVGFITRGGLVAFCRCGAVQIVDPERECHARTWLRAAGWSRPPTNLADPNDGWFCPTCTTPHDTRTAAHRLTVTPETLRRAEALGFEPGDGDVLEWALNMLDPQQADTVPLAAVVTEDRHVELLETRLVEVEAERDAAATKERAAVVAWLAESSGRVESMRNELGPPTYSEVCRYFADAIEAGDHLEVSDD